MLDQVGNQNVGFLMTRLKFRVSENDKDYSVDTMLANKRKIMECIAHLPGQTSLRSINLKIIQEYDFSSS